MNNTDHQKQQIETVNAIERQIQNNSIQFSTVDPVTDYEKDPRICLTSVHFLSNQFISQIQKTLIQPLQSIESNAYYYPRDSMHMTIKNVRVIHDPPTFNENIIEKAKHILSHIIPMHQHFSVYFYRLLLFPYNLSLIGTTDPELDSIFSDLSMHMENEGIPSDSVYTNNRFIFSNVTLARFYAPPSQAFCEKVSELSQSLSFEPYTVDSVSLISGNAVFKNKKVYGKWMLR